MLKAGVLALPITTATAQYGDSAASLKNHAIASSPLAREEFSTLSRGATLEKGTAEEGASRLAESAK